MIKLRRFHTPEKLAEIYRHTYDPSRWIEHDRRIWKTIHIARQLITEHDLKTVSDLSCGNRAIVNELVDLVAPLAVADLTGGGPIEESLALIEPVDLFICTETIEHLEAPWTVLERIAEKTRWLVLSTPLDEDPAIGNYEHYWSFTKYDVESMLGAAGFVDLTFTELSRSDWTYTYQLWTARSA